VDKKTLQSNSRLEIINQNPNSISNRITSNIHSRHSTYSTKLAKSNSRRSNLSNHLHDHSSTHSSNKQKRHPKPQRNPERTRTNPSPLHPTTVSHRKIDTNLSKIIIILGAKYQTMLKTEGEGISFLNQKFSTAIAPKIKCTCGKVYVSCKQYCLRWYGDSGSA